MKTLGIIFSNIYDSLLGELTDHRTVASLPFGGRYRQIDFVLSNMSNSGITKVGIVTKYNYQSLRDHQGSGQDWDLNIHHNGLNILPPYASSHEGVYHGKLEALSNSLSFLTDSDADFVVLSDSVVQCAIDFRDVVQEHIDSGADVTIVAVPGRADGHRVLPFAVRAASSGEVTDVAIEYAADDSFLCATGMFVMRRDLLVSAIQETVCRGQYHLEKDFLQRQFYQGNLSLHVYLFRQVALFNTSIQEFYDNNLALLRPEVRQGLFYGESTIYTKIHNEIPTYYGPNAQILNCLVADGCHLEGLAEQSVLFREVKLSKYAAVSRSVIMKGVQIGEGAVLDCVILDSDVTVRDHVILKGTPEHPVIVKKGATI